MSTAIEPELRQLSELRHADEPAFGGKSSGLGELLGAGIRVPPGFAISCKLAKRFGTAARGAPFEPMLSAAVAEQYRQLGQRAGEDEPAVAVRSSAIGEDSAEAAFAGQQETYLWVRGAEAVCEAVRDCWTSLYSAEAISYRAHLGGQRPAEMGVAVQLMVDAAVSGVLFTCNPLSGDPSMVAINAGWGLGPAVVGGEITPDDLLVSKVTGEVVRESVGAKAIEYVPDPAGGGMLRRDVPAQRAGEPCLSTEARATLLDLARACERHFGCHQDVEWAIARTGEPPGNVFVVQSRPVTVLAKRPPAPASSSALAMVMSRFGAAVERDGC